ncbi:MAG: hypothetical protein ACYCTB_11430 [bacterium]
MQAVVFWVLKHILDPLTPIGTILTVVDILILLPLSLFKKLRIYTGFIIYLSSFLFGFLAWLAGFIITYITWGIIGVIIGVLLLGVGVVPMAFLIVLFKGQWMQVLNLIILVVSAFVARIAGLLFMKSAKAKPINITDEDILKLKKYTDSLSIEKEDN